MSGFIKDTKYTKEEVLEIYKANDSDLKKTMEITGYAETTVMKKLNQCGISFRHNKSAIDIADVARRIKEGESKANIAWEYGVSTSFLNIKLYEYKHKDDISPEFLFQQELAKLKKVDHTPKPPMPVTVYLRNRGRKIEKVMYDITDMFLAENQDDLNYYRGRF